MGKYASAINKTRTKLRRAAQDAKEMRGRMKQEELTVIRTYLKVRRRKVPPTETIELLLADIGKLWETPAAPAANAPDPKKELLRQFVACSKQVHKMAQHIFKQAKTDEALEAIMLVPARGVMRTPVPHPRLTVAEANELLGLYLLFIALVEKYARSLRGGT